jgi:hypothetical protein
LVQCPCGTTLDFGPAAPGALFDCPTCGQRLAAPTPARRIPGAAPVAVVFGSFALGRWLCWRNATRRNVIS